VKPFRLLVTGSRGWEDEGAVWKGLAEVVRGLPPDQELVLVSGACPTGADEMARQWALGFGAAIELHPANWVRHGRAAGPRRNAEMVALGADVCLAFIRNGSRGASHTANLAEQAGIETRRFTA
jgi:hypothetical protein